MPSKTHAVESIPSLSAAQNKARALLAGRCKPHLVQDVYLQNQGVRATEPQHWALLWLSTVGGPQGVQRDAIVRAGIRMQTVRALHKRGLVDRAWLPWGGWVYRNALAHPKAPTFKRDRPLGDDERSALLWLIDRRKSMVGAWASTAQCRGAGIDGQTLRSLAFLGYVDSDGARLPCGTLSVHRANAKAMRLRSLEPRPEKEAA